MCKIIIKSQKKKNKKCEKVIKKPTIISIQIGISMHKMSLLIGIITG